MRTHDDFEGLLPFEVRRTRASSGPDQDVYELVEIDLGKFVVVQELDSTVVSHIADLAAEIGRWGEVADDDDDDVVFEKFNAIVAYDSPLGFGFHIDDSSAGLAQLAFYARGPVVTTFGSNVLFTALELQEYAGHINEMFADDYAAWGVDPVWVGSASRAFHLS